MVTNNEYAYRLALLEASREVYAIAREETFVDELKSKIRFYSIKDTWNNPYRVRSWSTPEVEFQSAGPDGAFDTGDDEFFSFSLDESGS